jgi:hypothetical protein
MQSEDRVQPHEAVGAVYKGKATKAGKLKYVFYVNDGVRVSEGAWVEVSVEE